jgi:hypothetical protein
MLKHFMANSNEDTRMTSSSNLDDRNLREYYSAPFGTAIRDGHANAMMTAYNQINGIPAAQREYMIYLPLRNGVTSLEIGLPKGGTIAAGPAPQRRDEMRIRQAPHIKHQIGVNRHAILVAETHEIDHHVGALATVAQWALARAALLSLLGNALTGAGRQRFAEGLRFAEEGVAVAEEAGLSVPLVARGVSWINFIDGRFDAAEQAQEYPLPDCPVMGSFGISSRERRDKR